MTPLGLAGHWWSDFWYRPAPAVNLAAARIIFSLHALWILWSRDLAATSALPEAFWAGVSASERWRFLLFPGDGSLDRLLQRAAAVALIAAAVGIGPRLACFAASLLLYHLAPLETIYWTPNPFERGFTVSVMVLLVLSVSPSGDALAIWPRPKPRAPSSDYRWPLVLCQLLLCQIYFIAGWSKLFAAGIGWASAENLRRWMLAFSLQDQVWTVSGLGLWVAAHPLLCLAVGVSSLALDLGFIGVLFWRRLKPWLIGAALSFHAGILLVMGIAFLNTPQLLVFIDWSRLASRLRGTKA